MSMSVSINRSKRRKEKNWNILKEGKLGEKIKEEENKINWEKRSGKKYFTRKREKIRNKIYNEVK